MLPVKGKANDWENPAVFQRNRLTTRVAFFTFDNFEQARTYNPGI